MGKGMLFLLSAAVLSMGYLLYLPLPADFKNPWRGRAMAYGLGAAESLAYLMQLITGTPMGYYLYKWTNDDKPMVHKNYPELEVEETKLDGVRVMIYRRKEVQGSNPAVVYFHGGGWVMSGIDGYDGWNLRLALSSNMTIVAVDYRKAPVYPYPGPFNDCVAVTMYVLKHGDELNVDTTRVGVAGDSAGGNLAAAVALRLTQEDPSAVPPLKFQVLLCPALQALTFNTHSYKDVPPTVLSRKRMIMLWSYYLGIPYNSTTLHAMLHDRHVSRDLQQSRHGSYAGKGQSVKVAEEFDAALAGKLDKLVVDPFIAPLMADEDMLKKVAPAYTVLFEFDQLRDEGMMYADRLKRSGVRSEVKVVKGQTHPGLTLMTMMVIPEYENLVEDVATHLLDNM